MPRIFLPKVEADGFMFCECGAARMIGQVCLGCLTPALRSSAGRVLTAQEQTEFDYSGYLPEDIGENKIHSLCYPNVA